MTLSRFSPIALALLFVACGNGNDRPVAPTPVATPAPAPAPAPAPTPAPGAAITQTFTGTLSAGDLPCVSVSIQDGKPCRRHAFTVSGTGTLTATLSYPSNAVDLDVELWRGSTRVLSSLGVTSPETISSAVQSGSYEIRVVYYNGSIVQNYTVTVTRPN